MLRRMSSYIGGRPRLSRAIRSASLFLWMSAWIIGAGGLAVIGRGISMTVQKEILSNLQTVGAVIFGIVGAWIAIIYPRTVEAIAAEELKLARKKETFLRSVMLPLKISAFVFIFALVLLPVVIVLVAVDVDSASIRSCVFISLVCCTVLQVLSVVLSLRPVFDAQDLMADKLADRDFVESVMPDAISDEDGESLAPLEAPATRN